MKRQNIKKKLQQKDLNLLCKTDKKTIKYMNFLPRDKILNKSLAGNESIMTSEDKYEKLPLLYYEYI